MKKVAVVGAGFAGLTVALRLAQRGFKVDIYEQADRVGGLLGTDTTEHGIAERAANALIMTERSVALFEELGVPQSVPLASAKKRFFFRDTPRSWPLNFKETAKFIGRLASQILKGGKKSFTPAPQETLKAWGLRHLGDAPTQFILEPAMQGIYGNEISGLSSHLILGALFGKKKRSKYKGLLTGPGGMQDLVDHLEKKLKDLGVRVHLNTSVDLAQLDGPVVLATSANAAAFLVQNRDAFLSQLLGKIRMSSLMSVTLYFKQAQTRFQGFGCLVPRGYSLKTLGILMNSYIFKDRDKTYNETWMLGGVNEEALFDLEDTAILSLIAEERFKILGQKEGLLDYRINRWKNGLPYYDLTLEKVLEELDRRNLPTGLYLHGNYLGGIGLSKILERSEALADKIASKHG